MIEKIAFGKGRARRKSEFGYYSLCSALDAPVKVAAVAEW